MQFDNRKKAIILSDMYGLFNQNQHNINYILNLELLLISHGYVVTVCSTPDIAHVVNGTKNDMHKQFVEGGIEDAVNVLVSDQITYELAVGFSIGGTVLWKVCAQFTKFAKKVICVSATRLRYETKPIFPSTHLVYGDYDEYKPNLEQVKTLSDSYEILEGVGHDFYRTAKNCGFGYLDWHCCNFA